MGQGVRKDTPKEEARGHRIHVSYLVNSLVLSFPLATCPGRKCCDHFSVDGTDSSPAAVAAAKSVHAASSRHSGGRSRLLQSPGVWARWGGLCRGHITAE